MHRLRAIGGKQTTKKTRKEIARKWQTTKKTRREIARKWKTTKTVIARKKGKLRGLGTYSHDVAYNKFLQFQRYPRGIKNFGT